jgi:hypothetical protein
LLHAFNYLRKSTFLIAVYRNRELLKQTIFNAYFQKNEEFSWEYKKIVKTETPKELRL